MLKKYRRQFVTLNMCLVGAVLLLTLLFIGFYMYRDYYDKMESTMSAVLQPLNSGLFDFSNISGSGNEAAANTARDAARKDILTVFYNENQGRCAVLSENRKYDDDTIAAIVSAVVEEESQFGKLSDYGLFYYRTGNDGNYQIALAEFSYLRSSMWDLILILLAIFVGAMVIFYFISRKISAMAAKPLEEAMQREKQFIADASHDLKTPLTVILANTEILRQDPEATVGQQSKWLDSTADAAENMQGMIQEMLTLSRAEAEEAPELSPVELSELAERSALQLESVAYERGITLDTAIEENAVITGNEPRLQRVLESLIGNAVKYEPEGGRVLVELRISENEVLLSVANPGSDISPEDLPHIFERFYRGDKTRSSAGGHGLGLAIAKQMTESMGGSIWAESGPGAGTRFTVAFPLADSNP